LNYTFKPKDLIPVPWLVALALQQDGWFLRSDTIWSKPNAMPSSVTDRPSLAHEYLLLLTKRNRYFYDGAAIAEPVSAAMLLEMEQGYEGLGLKDYESAGVQNPSSVKARIVANARDRWDRKRKETERRCPQHGREGREPNETYVMRNRRTVWTIPTQPYSGAHFATMPEALVEPCILAGCPLGGLVLDPFIGSGTVVAVAERLGRRGVGVDLSYQDLAKERTAQRGLNFADTIGVP
jgi:DNA modification methylase